MNKSHFLIFGWLLMLCSLSGYAITCPDPETTSLKWGAPPEPWVVNPYSPHPPQGEEGTRFVRANIIVARYGQGVICTYKNSLGDYSIWWQILTKIPAREDYHWINTLGGFVCTEGLEECQFVTAES